MSANTLMFSPDTKRSEVDTKLAMQAVRDEYKEFCRKWQIYAQTKEAFDLQRQGQWSTEGIKSTLAEPDTYIPDVPFYVLGPEGRVLVSSNFLTGLNVVYKLMPGAATPVCEGTDIKSILNIDVLKDLKKEGKVDAVCIVLKNDAAVAMSWVRAQIRAAGLTPEELLPLLEANNPNFVLKLSDDLPAIVVMANPGLEWANFLGLVFSEENALGHTLARANVFVGPDRKVKKIVKADTTAEKHCNVVLGGQMLADAKSVFVEVAPSQALTSKF